MAGESIMSYLFARLKEPSTWFGIISATLAILSSFKVLVLTPEEMDSLLALSVAILGGGSITSKDSQ
jgi:hypothetical protein